MLEGDDGQVRRPGPDVGWWDDVDTFQSFRVRLVDGEIPPIPDESGRLTQEDLSASLREDLRERTVAVQDQTRRPMPTLEMRDRNHEPVMPTLNEPGPPHLEAQGGMIAKLKAGQHLSPEGRTMTQIKGAVIKAN